MPYPSAVRPDALPEPLAGTPPFPLPSWVPRWSEQAPLFGAFALMFFAGPLMTLVGAGKLISPRGIDVFTVLGPLLTFVGPAAALYQVLVMKRLRWRLQNGRPFAAVIREVDATGPIWRLSCTLADGKEQLVYVHTRQLARIGRSPKPGDTALLIAAQGVPRPMIWGFKPTSEARSSAA